MKNKDKKKQTKQAVTAGKVKISTFFKENAHRVTTVTEIPRRLSEDEQECVAELNAFARSGAYAMSILQKVYPNILEKYNVSTGYMHDILSRAGLYLDTHYRIKTLAPAAEEDESPQQLKISRFFQVQP